MSKGKYYVLLVKDGKDVFHQGSYYTMKAAVEIGERYLDLLGWQYEVEVRFEEK